MTDRAAKSRHLTLRITSVFPQDHGVHSLYQIEMVIGKLPCKQRFSTAKRIVKGHFLLGLEKRNVVFINHFRMAAAGGPVFIDQIPPRSRSES